MIGKFDIPSFHHDEIARDEKRKRAVGEIGISSKRNYQR